MRLSLRYIVPLLVVLSAMAYAVVPLVDRLTVRWFIRDLGIRATLVARTIEEPLAEIAREGNRARAQRLFTKIAQDERIFALAYCEDGAKPALSTVSMPPEPGSTSAPSITRKRAGSRRPSTPRSPRT